MDTVLELGPRFVNVQGLTILHIIKYLSIYSNRLNSDQLESRTDPSAVRRLSSFWEWEGAYEQRDELFPQIRNFPLLPPTNGLRRAESALFRLRCEHPHCCKTDIG